MAGRGPRPATSKVYFNANGVTISRQAFKKQELKRARMAMESAAAVSQPAIDPGLPARS
jgi:hypothetical protein